jgi:hypothetical protein
VRVLVAQSRATADAPRGGASAGRRLTIGRASRDRRSQPIFNSYKPFTIWVAHHAPGTKAVADLVKFPSFEDPREPENSNPKVELVEEILLSRDLAKVPSKLRWYYRLQQHSRSWSRRGTIIQHSRCSRCWCASRGRCRDCLPLLRNPACSMWRRLAWQRARRTAPVFLACAPEVAAVKLLRPAAPRRVRPVGRCRRAVQRNGIQP